VIVVRMKQKGHIYSILEIANRSLNILFIILFVSFIGDDYKAIIYAAVASFLILAIIAILFERRFWTTFGSDPSMNKNQFKDVMLFSYPIFISTMITWLFQSLDRFSLQQWSTFEELGLYAAALKIIALLSVIQVAYATFWSPVCFEHYEKHPEDTDFFARMARVVAIVMFLLGILLIAGKGVVVLILGESYREAALIMPFLLFMPVLYTITSTTGVALQLLKKNGWQIVIAVVSCIVNAIGCLFLVPEMGAIGAALATAVSYIVMFALRTHLSQMFIKIDFGLLKMYTMIVLIFTYALCSVLFPSIWTDGVIGLVLLIVLYGLYHQDFRKLSWNRVIHFIKSKT
jgi:O-antigen/teichoic acid export membrane protein